MNKNGRKQKSAGTGNYPRHLPSRALDAEWLDITTSMIGLLEHVVTATWRFLSVPWALEQTKPPCNELTPAGCWHWEAVTRRARSNFRPVWTISACRRKQSAIRDTWQLERSSKYNLKLPCPQALVSKPSMLSAPWILESRYWYQNGVYYYYCSCWNCQGQMARARNEDNHDSSGEGGSVSSYQVFWDLFGKGLGIEPRACEC